MQSLIIVMLEVAVATLRSSILLFLFATCSFLIVKLESTSFVPIYVSMWLPTIVMLEDASAICDLPFHSFLYVDAVVRHSYARSHCCYYVTLPFFLAYVHVSPPPPSYTIDL